MSKLKKFNEQFEEIVEKSVKEIETKTSAEVVVTISRQSDSYIDTFFKGGFCFLGAMLLFLLYSPIYFPEILVPFYIIFSFLSGGFLVFFFPPLKRVFISSQRRELLVSRAASAFFLDNGLVETRERTACLLYFSVIEHKFKLVADIGIKKAIPTDQWNSIETEIKTLFSKEGWTPESIIQSIKTLETPFAKFLPPAQNNIDEISNETRRDN